MQKFTLKRLFCYNYPLAPRQKKPIVIPHMLHHLNIWSYKLQFNRHHDWLLYATCFSQYSKDCVTYSLAESVIKENEKKKFLFFISNFNIPRRILVYIKRKRFCDCGWKDATRKKQLLNSCILFNCLSYRPLHIVFWLSLGLAWGGNLPVIFFFYVWEDFRRRFCKLIKGKMIIRIGWMGFQFLFMGEYPFGGSFSCFDTVRPTFK